MAAATGVDRHFQSPPVEQASLTPHQVLRTVRIGKMTGWEHRIIFLYGLLLMGNFLLLVACLIRGYRLKRVCRLALWINGVFLLLALTPLVLMVATIQTSPEARLALLAAVLMLPAPLVAELLAFAAICRWRMREPSRPTG